MRFSGIATKKSIYLIFMFIALIFVYRSDIFFLPKYKNSIKIAKFPSVHRENEFYKTYQATFKSLHKTITKNGSSESTEFDIEIFKISDLSTINKKYHSGLKKPESFFLGISDSNIIISALSDAGLLNGLSTLEVLIDKNKGVLQKGEIIDYPALKRRVLHLSMWPCTIEDFKETIRLARLKHFNAIIWLNHFGVKLESLAHLKINNKNQWSIEQFKEMVVYVKQNGLEIIPELKLLSHQKKFMANRYPQYMFNKATYDPNKKELYDRVVFPAIDELLLLTGATKFHIGHDEVAGWHEWHYRKNILNKNEKQLPSELFVQDILVLNDYLRKRGVETWMWSDMFYTKDEFSSMKKAGANLNGMNGFSVLRSKIPKDIVMNVWHYRGNQKKFPTADLMLSNGHRVLGATWKFQKTIMNYANYIYKLTNFSNNTEGMIATTWYGLSGKKKKDVHEIIEFSGEAFWNAN